MDSPRGTAAGEDMATQIKLSGSNPRENNVPNRNIQTISHHRTVKIPIRHTKILTKQNNNTNTLANLKGIIEQNTNVNDLSCQGPTAQILPDDNGLGKDREKTDTPTGKSGWKQTNRHRRRNTKKKQRALGF